MIVGVSKVKAISSRVVVIARRCCLVVVVTTGCLIDGLVGLIAATTTLTVATAASTLTLGWCRRVRVRRAAILVVILVVGISSMIRPPVVCVVRLRNIVLRVVVFVVAETILLADSCVVRRVIALALIRLVIVWLVVVVARSCVLGRRIVRLLVLWLIVRLVALVVHLVVVFVAVEIFHCAPEALRVIVVGGLEAAGSVSRLDTLIRNSVLAVSDGSCQVVLLGLAKASLLLHILHANELIEAAGAGGRQKRGQHEGFGGSHVSHLLLKLAVDRP